MKKIFLIVFVSTFVFTSCKKDKQVTSNEKTSQETEHISNTDFKTKIASNNVQLIDVRTPGEYKKGHLENATLIDYKDENFVKNALAKLDKSKPVYVYCHSGHRSANSAALLQKEGFKVYDMKGGISGWKSNGFKTVTTEENTTKTNSENKNENENASKEQASTQTNTENNSTTIKETVKNKSNEIEEQAKETTTEIKETVENKVTETAINVKEEVAKQTEAVIKEKPVQSKPLKPALIRTNTPDFKSKIEGKNVQLVDVRTPKEYKDGHIPKAKNINIYDDDFIQQASVLDKSKPVYVYCRSGVRSMKAANKLKNAGYKVYNLNDGIKGWKREGNKTEK